MLHRQMKSQMGTKGLLMLWLRSSVVLYTLGGDHKASPNCFSARYILREFEVPTTAAQLAWLIAATLPLKKKLCDEGQFKNNPCSPEFLSLLKCNASLTQLILYCSSRD